MTPEPTYGFDLTYHTHDGQELDCHYKTTSEATARRKTLLRPKARTITSVRALTERQYVAAFGRGRM